MPKSNLLRKKSKKGITVDFKRPKAKVGSLPLLIVLLLRFCLVKV